MVPNLMTGWLANAKYDEDGWQVTYPNVCLMLLM
jgi:hypothetical protein